MGLGSAAALVVGCDAGTIKTEKGQEMSDIEKRLDALESRDAIKELRSRYAWFAMRGDAAGVASLFTGDCVFDGPDGPGHRTVINGRKNLEDFLAPRIGNVGAVLPLIHNHLTQVDADTGTGSCVMETPMAPGFGHLVCEYIEKLKRVDGKWYFAERKMYLYIPTREEQPT